MRSRSKTLKRTASPRVHPLGQQFGTRVAFWTKSVRDCFPTALLTFDWHRINSFPSVRSLPHQAYSSSSSKIGPQTTRPHSTTNRLKCATLYDCYEYGLETLANPWQTRHRTDVGTSLPANQKCAKERSGTFMCAGYEIFCYHPIWFC